SSDPHKIALSLKRSAERSKRRKSVPYRSAMSMLTFYINRAVKNLPHRQVRVLERAKGRAAQGVRSGIGPRLLADPALQRAEPICITARPAEAASGPVWACPSATCRN
ncbi:MAG TPA: DUF3175 domain-containing protein, partial [Dongiaceae bacterium]